MSKIESKLQGYTLHAAITVEARNYREYLRKLRFFEGILGPRISIEWMDSKREPWRTESKKKGK